MFHKWKRTIAPALMVVAWVGEPPESCGQDPAPPAKGAELKSPDPIPEVKLLPDLKTTPVRKGAPSFNEQMVDASLLPRDKEGIWVLDFAFKPLRMITMETRDKGRRQLHYLAYRVVNHTKKPREFV